jgi:MmyB-like transcription regulator ligand binding domain
VLLGTWTLDSITTWPRLSATTCPTCSPLIFSAARFTPTSTATNGARNFARFTFLDSAAHRFYPDWDLAADTTVANLRTAAGQDPH